MSACCKRDLDLVFGLVISLLYHRLIPKMAATDYALAVMSIGAPVIGYERLSNGLEPLYCLQALGHFLTHCGYKDGNVLQKGKCICILVQWVFFYLARVSVSSCVWNGLEVGTPQLFCM